MDLDDKTMNLIWWHFYWSDVTVSRKGKCHTFYSPVDLVGSEWLFQFTGDADVNKIRLTIHDPDYFLITESPSTVQQKNLMIDQGFYAMYLDFTHKIELSQEEQPCESSESYSFTICVRNSVSKKVGCRYILFFINLGWNKSKSVAVFIHQHVNFSDFPMTLGHHPPFLFAPRKRRFMKLSEFMKISLK